MPGGKRCRFIGSRILKGLGTYVGTRTYLAKPPTVRIYLHAYILTLVSAQNA